MNLIDAIDRYLLTYERRPRLHHYASDVLSCKRKLWYKWMDAEESNPIRAGVMWKMRIGDSLHEMITGFLRDAGFELVPEVADKKNIIGLLYPISYRVDLLFRDEDGVIAGVDYKTSYGRGITEMQKSGMPKDEHLAQIIVYMECAEIERFYLLYLGRDNAYRTQFVIDWRGDRLCCNGSPIPESLHFDALINRLAALECALAANLLPSRDYLVAIKNGEIRDKFQHENVEYKSAWQCRYCVFKDNCWRDVVAQYRDGNNAEMFTVDYHS